MTEKITAKTNPTGVRSEWKRAARKSLKAHYFMMVALVLIAAFYGTEFTFIQSHMEDMYATVTGQEVDLGGKQLKARSESFGSVYEDLVVEGDVDAAEAAATERADEYKDEPLTNAITGRQRGIFATLANNFSSGQFYVTIYKALNSIIKSKSVVASLMVLISMLITIGIFVFAKMLYIGVVRRMFLEARLYQSVPIGHVMHFKLTKRWVRASWTLTLRLIFQTLWGLTIVGGVIKYFSYFLVPFIVAENPDIKPREAINLSRRMMDGYKWECCKLQLSFIGWFLLGYGTFGILDALYTAPYYVATTTEYYAQRRAAAIEAGVEGTEQLNDTYLYEYDEESHLRKVYADIEEHKKYIDENRITLTGVRGFFANYLGLWFGSSEEKKQYDEVDTVRQQIAEDRAVIKHKIYPQRLNPLWNEKNNSFVRSIHYLRTYTIWSIILVFFVFAFIGWAYEVSIHLIQDGVFVNRGAFHGPWLPIYGGGVAMILVVLAKFRQKVHLEIALIIVLCGIVEFFTSYFIEMSSGLRYWDYTGYFLNLNGRICGEGLLVFALGGAAAVYMVVPLLDSLWSKINVKILAPICIVLVGIFVADVIYSHYVPNVGEGITDYDSYKKVESTIVERYLGEYEQCPYISDVDWHTNMVQ